MAGGCDKVGGSGGANAAAEGGAAGYGVETAAFQGAMRGAMGRDCLFGNSGDDTLIIDFNFAYNPSCVYDEAWACPLPQAGNTVTAEIPVGELLPANY